MTTSTFKRAEVSAMISRTLLYGPVPEGSTAIIFSGTFSNMDSTVKGEHLITLEIKNSNLQYIAMFKDVPVPYGGTSKCPKTVLLPGEYLYVSTDANNMIQAKVDILERG